LLPPSSGRSATRGSKKKPRTQPSSAWRTFFGAYIGTCWIWRNTLRQFPVLLYLLTKTGKKLWVGPDYICTWSSYQRKDTKCTNQYNKPSSDNTVPHCQGWGSFFSCLAPGFLATKLKIKVVPLHAMEAHLGERRYTSYFFLTSALEGGERSASRPGRALPPGKEPPGTHCIGGWRGQEPVRMQRLKEKSSASAGDQTPVIQSVLRHYTDWAKLVIKKQAFTGISAEFHGDTRDNRKVLGTNNMTLQATSSGHLPLCHHQYQHECHVKTYCVNISTTFCTTSLTSVCSQMPENYPSLIMVILKILFTCCLFTDAANSTDHALSNDRTISE
jgi:hypothetical protein